MSLRERKRLTLAGLCGAFASLVKTPRSMSVTSLSFDNNTVFTTTVICGGIGSCLVVVFVVFSI